MNWSDFTLRHVHSLAREPGGATYEGLIEIASQVCTRAILVKRASAALDPEGRALLEALRALNGEERESGEWPGTRLLGGTATVVTFDVCQAPRTLLESAGGLYRWQQPKRPEDLCLVRADGSTSSLGRVSDRRRFVRTNRLGSGPAAPLPANQPQPCGSSASTTRSFFIASPWIWQTRGSETLSTWAISR